MTHQIPPDSLRLSVILPCYNGAETLAVQLDALERQRWPGGWDVIVVNNGSTDDSMAIAESYQGRLPGLKIVQAHVPGTVRLGVPHSYNTGIKASSSDAFAFCEADDEVAPDWLYELGMALTEHDFVAARLDHRKLNAEWLHPPKGEGFQSDGLFRLEAPPHYLLASGCGCGLRRELYDSVGPLSTTFPIGHDMEYCWRLQLAGYAVHFEPKALVHYRERAGLKARYRQGYNWGRDYTRLSQRYGAPLGRLPLPRQLLTLARALPPGLWAGLLWTLHLRKGQALLSEWMWNFGWARGRLAAILQTPPALAPALAGGMHGKGAA